MGVFEGWRSRKNGFSRLGAHGWVFWWGFKGCVLRWVSLGGGGGGEVINECLAVYVLCLMTVI